MIQLDFPRFADNAVLRRDLLPVVLCFHILRDYATSVTFTNLDMAGPESSTAWHGMATILSISPRRSPHLFNFYVGRVGEATTVYYSNLLPWQRQYLWPPLIICAIQDDAALWRSHTNQGLNTLIHKVCASACSEHIPRLDCGWRILQARSLPEGVHAHTKSQSDSGKHAT